MSVPLLVRRLVMLSIAAALIQGAALPATAITSDVAKTCRALMIKAYPPAVAGSKQGTAKEERQYYQACLAKGGQMDAQPPAESKSK